MDERSLERTAGFNRLQSDLARLVRELAEAFDAGLLTRPEAAE
jgi:hypothetical protein